MNKMKACPAGAPNCTPNRIQNDPLTERTAAIVNSIASGNNACGSLIGRDGRANVDFIAASVRPTLNIYEREAADLRRDLAAARADAEAKRFALESVVASGTPLSAETLEAFKKALPGHPHLS